MPLIQGLPLICHQLLYPYNNRENALSNTFATDMKPLAAQSWKFVICFKPG